MATLGWLTWRVYHRGSSSFQGDAPPVLPPDAYFFTVRAGDRQVGIASITVDTLTDGVQITERLGLDLPIHPSSPRSQYTSIYTIGPDLRLREFRITAPGPTGPVVTSGIVEGDSQIVVSPGTGDPRFRVPVRGYSLVPPLAAAVVLAQERRLRVGESAAIPVFDPVTLSPGRIEMTVLEDSVFLVPDSADFDTTRGSWVAAHSDTLEAYQLYWSDGNLTQQVWVDHRGLPIRMTGMGGLSLDRSAFEIVTINYRNRRDSAPADRPQAVIPRTTIAAGVTPALSVGEMRVRLATHSNPWHLPRDTTQPFQFMEGSVAVVRRPTSLDPANEPADSSQVHWLADGPWLGLGDSAIQAQARALAAQATTPGALADTLARWVSRNIGRTADPLVPRAAMVLRARQADVDGHTLLFVALARAAGLPARPVSGILLAENRFYLHSWAEVYLGRWVPVDPTWGEAPASANRVRFGIGTLARPAELLPLVLGLNVELVTLTPSP